MTAATIKYEVDENAIATITLNRDEKRNALSNAMAKEILRGLDRAEQEHARVVVIRANAGANVWCAGHDLNELDPKALAAENATLEVCRKIQSTPLPVIAMVEGSVHAGGLIILLCADIVIAARNAHVAITANKLGIPLPPEFYAFWLRVMGLHKAKELLFTASSISPEDAYHAGLYNHVVDNYQLERATNQIARKILDCNAESVANTKFQLNLIASQASLTEEESSGIQTRNAELLDSPRTQARITALLASLRRC